MDLWSFLKSSTLDLTEKRKSKYSVLGILCNRVGVEGDMEFVGSGKSLY